MPIYEYRCAKCGFQKEYLQRLSDAPLTKCPECGKKTFNKMVTAAGFQLKGTGWYATDFKNSGSKKKSGDTAAEGSSRESSKDSSKDSSKESSGKEASAKEAPAKESTTKESSKSESKSAASSAAGS